MLTSDALVEFLAVLAVSVPGSRLFVRQLRAEAREWAVLEDARRLLQTVDWDRLLADLRRTTW